jgi:hypothetical protein
LRVRSRKSRDESNEETGFRRPFDDSRIGLHEGETNTPSPFLPFSASPRETVPVN